MTRVSKWQEFHFWVYINASIMLIVFLSVSYNRFTCIQDQKH